MKRTLTWVVIVIVVVIAIAAFMRARFKFKQFEKFKEPKIITMADQKMLIVEVKGDPNMIAKSGYAVLYKAFFALKAPGKKMPVPRARWPIPLDSPKEQWTGTLGLPVPDAAMSVPEIKDKSGLKAALDVWIYGEVAQILHVGSYATEDVSVSKLKKFVDDSGYRIAGAHEEEYLRGPESGSNQEKYMTLIRYPVEKKIK
jgi:hypothetical protein